MIIAGVFGLALQASAIAQIYESEDAEGVPDFSDTPTTGAQVVDLPATNLMEPPAAEEPPPPPEPRPAPSAGDPAAGGDEQEEGYDGFDYVGDDEDDPRVRRHVDEDRIDNALPGGAEPVVGSPGGRAGVPEAEIEPRSRR